MNDSARDIEAVRTTVVAVAHHIDHKRWTELRALYASHVDTDYSSLFGVPPSKQSADDLIGGWKAALEHVVTQHLLGPIEVTVDGASAHASCHVRALHYKAEAAGGDTWEVLGHYRFMLVRIEARWTIAGMTLETQHQIGNRALLASP